MTVDDAARWAEVLAAGEEVDRRGEHYSAGDCAEELADPEVDLLRDSLLVLDGERPVASQVLWTRGRVVHSDGMVHPSHRRRGIGTALLEAARRRAGELGAEL
jgi:GNAT superfamily N-acetyltransferase